MPAPLNGIKVVEITMFQQGPVAGMLLGDLGADVIKVEALNGDPARGMMRLVEAEAGITGVNYYFEHCNRNKRGIAIDLKSTSGKGILLKLINKADVFLTNMSIEAPIKMGIEHEDVSKRNPRIIYAQASGWGRKGEDASLLSFDYTGIGRSGMMMTCGEDGDPPAQILPGISDELGGIVCAQAVIAALYAREKTGRGQVVDTSLMGSIISMLGLVMSAPAILGKEFPRKIRALSGNPLYNHYRCSDDKWIILAHLQPEIYWPKICRALDMIELENDPRFSSFALRMKNAAELIKTMDDIFAGKTRDEWMKALKREGCIFTPVQTPIEVVSDDQAWANNYFVNVDHPEWGKTRMVGFPWDFSETPASWRRKAPGLGEHTEEILKETGYTEKEIAVFKSKGVLGQE